MLLDMHVVHALANGWTVYRDSLDAFTELLMPGVSAAVSGRWHALLVSESPEFRSAFAPGTPEGYPLVSVELTGEQVDKRALGNALGMTAAGTQRELGYHVRQTAEITVLSKRDETLRALALIIRAVLLRAVPSFLRSGYVDLAYDGMGEVGLEEMLVAEEIGITIIRLRYTAALDVTVPDPPAGVLATKPWFVQLDDVTDDPTRPPATGAGTPGGVTPSTD